MKKNVFYAKFLDFLEIESVSCLNESTSLKDLDEYDSFFVLTIVAFVDDNFSIKLSSKQLSEIETIEDLMTLIGNDKFVD
jgi:acyl carrier protein